MAVTISSITLIGGNPPTQVQVSGTYTACEKLDVWISCKAGSPGTSRLFTVPSPFIINLDIPRTCNCGDTITVWVDCHQGLGVPSNAAAQTTLSLDCDCCPQVSIASPVVASTGGVTTASFALTAPVSWLPAGCTPPVNITGYQWTVSQGATQYQLTTSAATAGTNAGNWTTGVPATPATVPLTLAAGSWDVKVRPVFSSGTLSANCDTSDSTSFTVTGAPPPQCCPFDATTAPHGVTVTAVTTGAAPTATATFTAVLHWPAQCMPVNPVAYIWEVTDSTGQKFSRQTTTNVTSSNDPGADWSHNGVQVGALPLSIGGTWSVVCTVTFPANSTADGCPAFGTSQFPVAGQPPPTSTCCPAVTASATIAGKSGKFSATVTWPAGCKNIAAGSFTWTVTDTTTSTGFTKTTTGPTTDQTGFTPPLVLTPGHSYTVSVTPAFPGVTLPAGCTAQGTTTVSAPASPPSSVPVTPPPSSSNSSLCAFLLVLAIVLDLVGSIVFIIGVCVAVVWLWIVGLAIVAIGLILFVIWAFVCASITPCSLMLTIECILDWIVKLGWIVALVLFIVGGQLCGLGALAAWGGWSVLDSFLRTVMFRVGCPPIDCTMPRP